METSISNSSNNNINQQQQATDGTAPPPAPDTQQGGEPSTTAPNLTKTKYDVMAEAVLKDLAALRAALPDAGVPQSVVSLTGRGRTNVPREFLVSAVTAVAASPELRAATQLDPDRGQETLQLLDAFGRVVTEFEQFARDSGPVALMTMLGSCPFSVSFVMPGVSHRT
jgi:hypothetical protein